jgi:hypothetical protein
MVSAGTVSNLDWGVLGCSSGVFALCIAGAVYSTPWQAPTSNRSAIKDFNYLWITRCCLQGLAALYSASMLLRLQILWSRQSILFDYGFHTDAMCRLYIGVSFGLLEPAFLLMVLFSCMYSVTPHQPPSDTSSPNLNIFGLAVGLTIPMCAAQVFAALFSKIITQLRYHELLLSQFFKASYPVPEQQCSGETEFTENCATCVFPGERPSAAPGPGPGPGWAGRGACRAAAEPQPPGAEPQPPPGRAEPPPPGAEPPPTPWRARRAAAPRPPPHAPHAPSTPARPALPACRRVLHADQRRVHPPVHGRVLARDDAHRARRHQQAPGAADTHAAGAGRGRLGGREAGERVLCALWPGAGGCGWACGCSSRVQQQQQQ